jgi:hypothetical protein
MEKYNEGIVEVVHSKDEQIELQEQSYRDKYGNLYMIIP